MTRHPVRRWLVGLAVTGVVLFAALAWLGQGFGGTQTIFTGQRAREIVESLRPTPLPSEVQVVAVLSDGFQDPYLQIRLENPTALNRDVLAWLGITSQDLRYEVRELAGNPVDWWRFPAAHDSLFATISLGHYDHAEVRILHTTDRPGTDVILIYAAHY